MKLKSRLLIIVMLVSVLLSVSVNASAAELYDIVDTPIVGERYYLVADVDGTDYFFRNTKSGESVTHTAPYSVCTTSDITDPNVVMVTLAEVSGGFTLDYPDGSKRIYSYDVDKDGVVDTGVNAKSVPANHYFSWDAENQYIYMMKGSEQYVLSVKKLVSSGSGTEEYRMLTVPSAQVDPANGVYPVRLAKQHVCSFSEEWASNEYSHWHPCTCDAKEYLQLHQVEEWTVTAEPAVGIEGSRNGICTVCGAQATEVIPALTEDTPVSEPEQMAEPVINENTQDAPMGINPIGLVAVILLAVTGIAVMIWGKKKDKA